MKIKTIEQHILDQQRKFPGASGGFSGLLYDIALAAKMIARQVNRAGLANVLGSTGEVNIQGEVVQKMDKYANELLINVLTNGGKVCAIASEENENIVEIHDDFLSGNYAINMDPLDGSSNIGANVSIGTIFSLHRKISQGNRGSEEDCLQKGSQQACAGYVIYGSSVMLVYSTGTGVHGFTLDPSVGEFILSHENIQIPEQCRIYSVNEGNSNYWDEGTKRYVNYLKETDRTTGRPFTSRYIGSLVSDFHRNLLYGGIFLYPADYKKGPTKPEGKLRLLFEAAPIAFIAEQAGGYATTGTDRILDIGPKHLHQRVPLIVGNKSEVLRYEEFIRRS
ncbi:MAG: fructose-bisphosphatase [Nitrospirae bacterium RIFCSPLOW2_12_42_9]|nr:MAG: fructose-bisphosphatase [Nitrospirae bacterium GWA2_42_11]OGW53252.1 MAG: fructose-bisphosphatase [Nitrospirae bacterium RIFCSPLOWO2_02_42_7]OGW55826.1 MAG: fructose-bisphosphatase [Nitrospirae bacterium RIFCSPHIGHO2_02_FULL_42_12]OGW60033.1 MAG: fructose-bisphosphatase [Nitrospirae bacterium RIFCSPLOW2_12_42_9]HAS18097.1 class 1 fructose-bisphosphatase [Nitrospiraceae bacterium]